jgi:hypothetical protein
MIRIYHFDFSGFDRDCVQKIVLALMAKPGWNPINFE